MKSKGGFLRLPNPLVIRKLSLKISQKVASSTMATRPTKAHLVQVHFLDIGRVFFRAVLRTKGAPLGAMVPGGTATAGAGESHETTILLLGRACDDHLSVPDFRDRTEKEGREG